MGSSSALSLSFLEVVNLFSQGADLGCEDSEQMLYSLLMSLRFRVKCLLPLLLFLFTSFLLHLFLNISENVCKNATFAGLEYTHESFNSSSKPCCWSHIFLLFMIKFKITVGKAIVFNKFFMFSHFIVKVFIFCSQDFEDGKVKLDHRDIGLSNSSDGIILVG